MHTLVLTTMLASSPSVAVEVEAPSPQERVAAEADRRWLVGRLLEEGVAVAPGPDSAGTSVTVTRAEGAVTLETEGGTYRIEPGPQALVRLELLHRTRLAAEEKSGVPAPPPQAPVVALELSGDASDEISGAVESELLDAGYFLTPSRGAADATVCLAFGPDSVQASVDEGSEGCGAPRYEVAAKGRDTETIAKILAALHVATVRDTPDVAGELEAAGALGPNEYAPTGAPLRVDSDPALHREGSRPWLYARAAEVRLGADGGVMGRGAVDGSVRTLLRTGMTPGPGAILEVIVTPSRSDSIRAVDTFLAVGPDYEIAIGRRFQLSVAGLVGARIHHYRVDNDSSGRVDWYVGVPVNVSWRLGSGARVHLVAEAGMSGGPSEHRVRDHSQWSRTAWSVRGGMGVTYGWRFL